MNHPFRLGLSASLLLTIAAIGLYFPTPSVAETVEVPFTPRTGALFNKPMGTSDEQYAIVGYIDKTIDATPSGSTIRIATYSYTADATHLALQRAFKRGVHLKVLIDSHVWSTEMLELKRLLGTDLSKRSYFRTCNRSCMSDKPSYQHAKLYMFSRSGSARWVSMVASSNLTDSAAKVSWNNMYTIVDDQAVYESNVQFIKDMLKDRTQTNYYRTLESGSVKLYYLPRSPGDTMENVLKGVSCTGAAPGYGDASGRTVIRIAMFSWTAPRLRLAERLWELDNQGCDVQIIYTADQVEEKPAAVLLRKKGARNGGIPVYNGRIDRTNVTHGQNLDTYMHHKYITIDGVYLGKTNSKVTFTGSANFTRNSLRNNTELMLKIDDDAITTAFQANFREMRSGWVKRVTSPIRPPAPDVRVLQQRGLVPAGEDDEGLGAR